ncbi:MAG: ribose-5-phosphate isomerase RpiA [Anaerolineae bacterium]|nr:ribose-5-phosphate isomerase RpiA [Anaerolineae bacterium]
MEMAELKRQAAEAAVDHVESGMVVGLGEGSTAVFAIRRIAALLQSGALADILGVPCSRHVEDIARKLDIPLTTLNEHPVVDLTIDGADEVDPALNVIKGGGGALLREKMVAQATRREIIVVDEGKLSDRLGVQWALPVEVLEFGWKAQAHFLRALGGDPVARRQPDGALYYTDQGNLILDTNFGPIEDVHALDRALAGRAGIVEHGLFLGLVHDVIVAGEDGLRHIRRAGQSRQE